MKASIILVLTIAMLAAGVTAFASSALSGTPALSPSVVSQWIGKPAQQLIKTFGDPSYSSRQKNGAELYDYVVQPQHVGAIPTYQFVIGRDGNVVSAMRSY